MKNICLLFIIFIGCFVLQSCNTVSKAPESGSNTFDLQKARSFFDSVNAKFTEQVFNGDSVALAAHYHSDAELLFSNSDPIKGKDILSAWGSFVRSGVKHFTFTTTDIVGCEGLLVETGLYEMSGENKTLIDKGKYVVVWKQENGIWKLYRDIGNSNLPAPVK